MSATISSSGAKAGATNRQDKALTGVDEVAIVKAEGEGDDAADFLLSNPKYHDCFFTVGNPENDQVEKIGVASLYLIANSPVFRKMLESCTQTDLPDSQTHITDISPVTFKYMLRYLYGGKLPKMTAIETAGLALCGDKYKVSRLVQKVLKRLCPTSAVDVFPALICVTYASFPDLEVQVSKIIQQETDKVVQHADFVKLDEECVLFIVKQNTMNIGELELWNNIVCWAKNQVVENTARTVRSCLTKILGYVRFLNFTSDEILEHVLPTEALTPEEFVDFALAVTKKQPLKSSLLCNVKEKRALYKEEEVSMKTALASNTAKKTKKSKTKKTKKSLFQQDIQNESETPNISRNHAVSETENKSKQAKFAEGVTPYKPKPNTSNTEFNTAWVFKASDYFRIRTTVQKLHNSVIKIIPRDTIEIESFTCCGKSKLRGKKQRTCDIKITKTEGDDECKEYLGAIHVEGGALCDDEIVLPLKFESGIPIVMSPGEIWEFELNWDYKHASHGFAAIDVDTPLEGGHLKLQYETRYSHVLQVAYKTQ